MKICDYYDVEELAASVLGVESWDDDTADGMLWDRHEISFEDFEKMVNLLIRYTPSQQSPLTGERFHAFVKDVVALAKMPV